MSDDLDFVGLDQRSAPMFERSRDISACVKPGLHRVWECQAGCFCAGCKRTCRLPRVFTPQGAEVYLQKDDPFNVLARAQAPKPQAPRKGRGR